MQPRSFEPQALSGAPLQLALLVPFLFLVVGQFIEVPDYGAGKPVSLPYVPHAPLVPYEDNDLTISVQADGMIFIDAKWYPAPEFQTKMLEYGERAAAKHILLRADHRLLFGEVRAVLQAVRSAGFKHLTLVTFEGPPAHLIAKTAA